MKLYATITDSRGKKEGKGDNEYLEVLLNEKNENRYLIAFNGAKIEVLEYATGEWYEIGNEKGKKQKGEKYCEICESDFMARKGDKCLGGCGSTFF